MGRDERQLRRMRGEALFRLLQGLTYGGCLVIFYALMAIPNWPLRNLSRTSATTLVTWVAMGAAMLAVFGRMTVRRGKHQQQAAGQCMGVLITDAVTYLQLQIMNVNPNNRTHLTLFGADFAYLLIAAAMQMPLVLLAMSFGARVLPKLQKPALLLLITEADADEIRQKLAKERTFGQLNDVCSWQAAELPAFLAQNDAVLIASDVPDENRMALMKACYALKRTVLVSPRVQEIMLSSANQVILDDAPLLEMRADGMTLGQKIIKRGADIVLSALALLVLSPLMLLIALAIRVEDGGNVIFRQKRLTADGKTFTICKFRTMRRGSGGASARDADNRVTLVGRFLRRWRLDELPQFWNILRGDMSLVGPRPEMLENITRYKRDLPEFQFRERMKAGLTGYAQIEGRYNTSPEDKLALDLFYIEGFSLWTDMKLLLRTVTVFFRPDATQGFPPEDSSFIPKHDKTQEEEQ